MNETTSSHFLYFSCQHGAENFIKHAWCEPRGMFRIAYSAKGFLTFKSPMALPLWTRALPEAPLIRSRGLILGKFEGSDADRLMDQIESAADGLDWQIMHVWERDSFPVGFRDFEPGQSLLASEIAERFRQRLKARGDERIVLSPLLSTSGQSVSSPRSVSHRVLEVVIDTPNRWWLGAKAVQTRYDRWPGGTPTLPHRDDLISRAYLKIAEAFAWAGFSLRPGEQVVEIGSAPGGACQWLLEQGARVTGIDPAEMHPAILANPRFTHWRSRSLQVKRRAFRNFRILVCDANVTPNYTLDTVEAITTYPTTHLRGLILTMKLPEWEHAHAIPEHVERVRRWGFEWVEARQLSHNRREYCLAARRRSRRKLED